MMIFHLIHHISCKIKNLSFTLAIYFYICTQALAIEIRFYMSNWDIRQLLVILFYLSLFDTSDGTFLTQIGCPIKNLGFTRAIGNQRLANAHRDSAQRRFFKEIAQKITFVWPQLGQWQISLDLAIHDHLGVCKVYAISFFAYLNLNESTSGS